MLTLASFKVFNIAYVYYFDVDHATAANSSSSTDSASVKKEALHQQKKQKFTIEKQNESEKVLENCDKEAKKIFNNLQERHNTLLNWEKELKDKEVVMATTKTLIENKIRDLQEKTKNLEFLISEYKKEASKRIKSLVKIYENMNPKEAAQILDRMETTKLIEIMRHMRESKSSQIIALMRPEKARDLTGTILVTNLKIMEDNYFN